MTALIEDVKKCYQNAYGEDATVYSRAPGRIEVLGNHTDYNEGFVLSCAIDKTVLVAAGKNSLEETFEMSSTHFPQVVKVKQVVPQRENAWVNYPLGVYKVLKDLGYPVGPFKIAIDSSVPLGAGLSSSAALEVAVGLALSKLFEFEISLEDLAKACQKAENYFVGANCGLLDQYSSVFGKKNHVLFIDFRSLEVDTVPIPDPNLTLAVTISGVSHSLVTSAYNDRRKECNGAAEYFHAKNPLKKALRDVTMAELLEARGKLDPLFLKRAMHPVGEDERVIKGITLLRKNDLVAFGQLLYESHESSRVNFENSCKELDILVDITKSIPGVYGSRLTGGGFGGATLTLLRNDSRELFEETIVKEYAEKTGRLAVVHFATVDDGACIIEG
jgi:galactokinase